MVTVVFAPTGVVAMLKSGDAVEPPGIVTEAGTVTPASLLASATTTPPAGAGPFSVTLFEVVEPPPLTDAGERNNDTRPGGVTVRLAVFVTPL
jgi:hypothetical protein